MLTTYMLAFAIASLSAIAVEDLKLGRFIAPSVTELKFKKDKISRSIKYLRLVRQRHKNKVNRAKTPVV